MLFGSPSLRAILHPAAGGERRPLVVTFDSLNADLRLDRPGFGQAWLRDAGYDAVHVVSADNAWYQHPDLGPACEAVRDAAAWALTRRTAAPPPLP